MMTLCVINLERASMDGAHAWANNKIVEPKGGWNTKAERERVDRSSNGTGNWSAVPAIARTWLLSRHWQREVESRANQFPHHWPVPIRVNRMREPQITYPVNSSYDMRKHKSQCFPLPTARSGVTSERRVLWTESGGSLGTWDIVYDFPKGSTQSSTIQSERWTRADNNDNGNALHHCRSCE